MTILVSGSLAFDKILNFPGRFSEHILPDRVHDINLSFSTENLSENFGGTAGNIAYNLALLGEDPVVLATVGNDFDPYRYWLETKGVDLRFVKTVEDMPTAFATIMADRRDNQIAAFYLGATKEPYDLPEEKIPQAELAIVAATGVPDMRRMIALHHKRKTPFIFDPGQQVIELSADDLKNGIMDAALVIANDYEIAVMLKKTGWSEEDVLTHAEMLVTTLAEKGSRIRTRKTSFDIPAAPISQVKDPTGAGDAYRAGFAVGLLRKWPLDVVGRFASVIAAYAVEGVGPQFHEFTFHTARVRYAKSFGQELPS